VNLCNCEEVHVKNKYGWTALIHAANSSGYYDQANVKECKGPASINPVDCLI